MVTLDPSMRLKVKEDTFFLPDPNGGVYFRNNLVSFRMEGAAVYPWIEKLMPVFNGEHSLAELTEGLPGLYRDRLIEIADVLYQNGFVRDVSQDIPCPLPDAIREKFAYQIEFLDSFGGSGAYRFQTYRQSKVLAVGSGPMLVSLAADLLESGLSQFHLLIGNAFPTNRQRLRELAGFAHKTDPETVLKEVTLMGSSWEKLVQPYDFILYVSQDGNIEELRLLQAVCKEERKKLLPAIFVQQAGLAGPLVHPESEPCWESAWRSLHRTAITKDEQLHAYSSTAGAYLTNVMVFELVKEAAGVTDSKLRNNVFLLNLETLEGSWHSFVPHPLVTGRATAKWVDDFHLKLEQSSRSGTGNQLLSLFSRVTSAELGIFESWEEADLKQLPLAQCRVRPANPLSGGPAELLPEIVGNGQTHEEARREAGLYGIEAYASRMAGMLASKLNSDLKAPDSRVKPHDFIGIGAGETLAESVCRGLNRSLTQELNSRLSDRKPLIRQVHLDELRDERCRFYWQALAIMSDVPMIGLGEEVFGFPSVWLRTGGVWLGSTGLNRTLALRSVLQMALLKAQNGEKAMMPRGVETPAVRLEENNPPSLAISSAEDSDQTEAILSALSILKRNHKRLKVFEIELEPFMYEEAMKICGVLLREEDAG